MVCNSLPGLNRTAFPGGMLTSAPVRGLRPIPVFRGRTLNTPNPRNSMRSPFASARFMLSKTVSTATSALVFVIPVRWTTSLMISSLITLNPALRGCYWVSTSIVNAQFFVRGMRRPKKAEISKPPLRCLGSVDFLRGSAAPWLNISFPQIKSQEEQIPNGNQKRPLDTQERT